MDALHAWQFLGKGCMNGQAHPAALDAAQDGVLAGFPDRCALLLRQQPQAVPHCQPDAGLRVLQSGVAAAQDLLREGLPAFIRLQEGSSIAEQRLHSVPHPLADAHAMPFHGSWPDAL